MSSSTRHLSRIALLAALLGCQVDKLVDPPPSAALIAEPPGVESTAALGSSDPRDLALAIRSARGTEIGWTVARRGSGAWLSVHDSGGHTPDSLHFTLDPTGLAAGSYADTLILIPDDPGAPGTRLPVMLRVVSCAATTVGVGIEVRDSLRPGDCASTRHPGRAALRYRFDITSPDSVSFYLTSSVFGADLIVDSSATGDGPPFAESTTCGALEGACLRYLRFPAPGTWFVEVTSTDDDHDTGPFTLRTVAPSAPGEPEELGQSRADSVTAIAVGGVTPELEFVVHGVLRDPDSADTLRLEVEVQPIGTSFSGEATTRSDPVPSGGTAFARISGLTDAVSYHWRSRVVDQTGRATEGRSFGGNPESAADLRIAVTADRLSFRRAPATTEAGAAFTPAVEVAAVDRDDVVVASFTGTVTVAVAGGPAGAILSGTRSVAAVGGVATFTDLSLAKAGTGYTLVASSPEMVGATSSPFEVSPGAATRLTFTQQPAGTPPDSMIAPAVVVTAFDDHQNVATAFSSEVTIALGHDGSPTHNAHLSGARAVLASGGVARFADLRIDLAGTGYTLVATALGLASDTSDPFDIAPIAGAPTALRFTRQPSAARTGAAITPAVEVTILDGRGEPVRNYAQPVTLALVGGTSGASLGGATSVTPVNGVARFDALTVDRAGGGYRLRATAGSVPEITSEAFDITDPPPTTGAVRVTTSTGGNDLDPDGYSAAIAGVERPIGVNGSIVFTELAPGSHSVALTGIATNCTLTGADPRNVTVVAGDTAVVEFALTCATIPPTVGGVRVTTATTGADPDPDGYTVAVAGVQQPVGVNGSTVFTGVAPGVRQATLTGVAPNCTVAGANPRDVTVVAGDTAEVDFAISCAAVPPPVGAITVNTHTTGSDLDADGYTVTVAGADRTITVNGTTTYNGLPVGSQPVALSGLAANCSVSGDNPRSVTVVAGGTATTTFEVTCAAVPPPTGSLTVNTHTTGSDLDADGYTVTVAGSDRTITVNGTTTYSGLPVGSQPVALSGLAANCSVTGANPRSVTVVAGSTATTTFEVTCTAVPPPTGSLTVNTHTTGSDLDPDGYSVSVGGNARTITINGSTTYSDLPAGGQTVALSGLAANCSVSGANPRSVTVAAGSTATTTFEISCAAAPPPTGSLTVNTHTTGSDLDPDGYSVSVGGNARSIGTNGSTTYDDLPAGGQTVALTELAGNCSVSGANPRSVTVVAGSTTTTTFEVTCAAVPPPTGSITVNTHTTGSDLDPDGYSVSVGGNSRGIGVNGSTTYNNLPAGGQSVALTGLAGNCSVSGANPRTVTVAAGSTATTTFEITCQGSAPPPATQLRFTIQPPAVTVVGGNLGVVVTAYDDRGVQATGYTGRVSVSLLGGILFTSLTGTTSVNAVGGVATFSDLRVTGPCVGCQLQATASGLSTATSSPFTIVVP